jgi:hypothetical protein
VSASASESELAPSDKRAEVLLRIVPVALAGGGSVTQSIQIDEWLAMLSEQHGVPVRRIGVAGLGGGFVDEQITGVRYPLDRAIAPGASVAEIYNNVGVAVRAELEHLYATGVRHFAAICCGYTSYGVFALRQAVDALNATHPDDQMTGNVVVQDSSFPDTDALSHELDGRGYPMTRFHGPAYRSTPALRVVFTLNGAVPFEIRLSKRCPRGCTPIMATFPYTPRYLASWRRTTARSKVRARARLVGALPGWERVAARDWVVPLLASGGCWDASSIGKWMTQEQFNTMTQGTLAIAQALRQVGTRGARRVVLPVTTSGADFLQQQAGIGSVQDCGDDHYGVVVAPFEVLPQGSYMDLILGADLVINRAVQANSFAETLLARQPQLVMTIPAAGYMDAELMAQGLPRGLVRYDQSPDAIGEEIYRVLTRPAYRRELVNAQVAAFAAMYADPRTNFGSVLARIAGLPPQPRARLCYNPER